MHMIKDLKYSKCTNSFPKELPETMSKIHSSQYVRGFSDKTRNFYALAVETNNNLIQRDLNINYRHTRANE